MTTTTPTKKKSTTGVPDVALMRALRFSADDLNANRAGKISTTQRKKWTPPAPSRLVQLVLGAHFVLIAGFFVMLALVSNSVAMWVVALLIIAVVSLPMTVVGGGFTRPVIMIDIRNGAVACASGTVQRETHSSGRSRSHHITIGGESWRVTRRIYEAFTDDTPYRVYYLRQSRQLLSAERD